MAVQRGSYLHRREKSLSRDDHIEHRQLYQVHLSEKFEDIEKLQESFISSSIGDFLTF